MKKFIILILLAIIGLKGLLAQDVNEIYLQTAAKNNPALKATFNQYMAALEKAPQQKALPDPQIAFAYFIQPVETRNGPQQFKISASQFFPWFGTLKRAESAEIEFAKAKYEAFEESKSKLFHDVRVNYYDLWFNEEAISITIENLDILRIFQKLAEIKVEAGLTSLVDEYRIEMEILELENQLSLLKDKQRVLFTSFRNLLNVDNNFEINIDRNLSYDDIAYKKEEISDTINAGNHSLLSLDFRQQALEYRKEWAEKKSAPSFKLGIDYINIGKGDANLSGKDAFVFPTVGISIPLYRKKYKALINEQVYLAAANTELKIDKINILETISDAAWKDYEDGNRRIELYIRQSELATKSLRMLETDYATSGKAFEEILRMERKLLKFQLELQKAKADKLSAISFIYYLMGK